MLVVIGSVVVVVAAGYETELETVVYFPAASFVSRIAVEAAGDKEVANLLIAAVAVVQQPVAFLVSVSGNWQKHLKGSLVPSSSQLDSEKQK